LRADRNGIVLHANAVCAPLLHLWGSEVGSAVSGDYRAWIVKALRTEATREIEIPCEGRLFSVILVPILEYNYVNFYGRDITERKRAAALEQLWGVGQAMSRSLALPETLDRIVQTARDLLRTDYARLTFWDGTRECLTHAAQAGAESLPIRHVRQAGDGVAGVVAKTSEPLIVNDYNAFRLSPPKNTEIHRQNSVHTRIDSQAVVHQPSRMMPRAPCLHLVFATRNCAAWRRTDGQHLGVARG
jgi:hypothetical protein